MEWKSNLRRAQSLKSIPSSCDRPAWPDARLLDRKASVSQLVARYQTTKEAGASFRATSRDNGEAKPPRHETAASPPQPSVNGTSESPKTQPETLTWRNEERKPSHVKPGFGRSQSMGALNSTSGSIGSLRALFESKGAAQNKPRAATKAAHSSSTVVMNLRAEETPTEQQGPQTPAETSVDGAKTAAQAESVSHKVVSHSRSERRRTIGGVDFERVAASQADEKRRSIADFRDSFLNQKQEKPCVSVKAISALYLSKVAPQEPQHRVARDQSSESGKRVKFTKMAEDSQPHKDDHPPIPSPRHQLGAVDNRPALSQPSKEMLHQQRQKCELRRLLKHTHPELKMLDRVVDEELAEVLSAETAAAAEAGAAAAETGYEGEVLSRRLIFENCAMSNKVSPYSRKMHMAEESAERGDVGRTSAVLEQLEERPCAANTEADKTLNPDPSRECEEEIVRIDVQATRRLFESQSGKASRPNPENKLQGKVAISGDEAGALQKQKTGFETCSKQHHNRPEKQVWCAVNQSTERGLYAKEEVFDDEPANPPDSEGEPIKTSLSLFQNNPFIAKNVEKENAYVHTAKPHFPAAADNADAEDYPADNVKNRAHLFESMPFDKIRSQNKDEVETMVEKIKESLSSLHRYKAVRSHGSIIEVNETVRAKKAKFTLSERGPEIDYDTVAEGNSQNFILHLLPRVNLKPQLTYLKEDKKGNMEAMAVNVPVHHRQFATNQDTECKTANVAQLVEDILNQDNSLRKGVIIQEGADRCADVVVYSLYNYMDEEDVRRYSPGEARMERRPSDEETPVLSTKEASWDQTSMEPIKSEVAVKGNVKLFKSCIEKGDLDYLKSLQDEPANEDPPSEQHTPAEEGPTEWVPVDVKKLKSMFSGDSNPPLPKQCTYKLAAQATAAPPAKVPCEKSSTESDIESFKECGVQGGVNPALWPFEPQPDDGIHQAELVEVVDEADEMMTLQAAIQNLQQATNEAKAFHNSLQEKHKLARGSSEPPNPNIETRSQLAEVVQKEQHLETALASSNSSEATAAPQEQKQEQEEEEVVFEGKLQAALDSLQKSNINVSRGDFRAAMIYRGSSKAAGAVQKPGELHPESTKKQGEAAEEVTADEAGGLQTNSAPLKKNRKPSGPKPAIPPKPEHLKMKQDSSAEIHPTKSNSDGGECKEDQIQGSGVAMEINNADKTANQQREDTNPQEIPAKENLGETDETPVDFKEAVKKFGGKKAAKVAPVKPKRVKIAQPEQKNTQPASERSSVIVSVDAEPQQGPDSGQKGDGKEVRGESKVELREKKRRAETEDERRQRLSVHMDEIMRGNIGAAMEIFDNLRKQEELQSILSRVEEIEEDTSEVDVRSLRRVFEDVPDWVVDGNQRKARTARAEHKEEPQTKESAESKSSMAHVFGDLERASAEIMNLKEQTLARLVDIEEAIKKALYSVSTLKSDSDIAGLSSLFKESMQGTPASGNISKISIGSSRTKLASEQEVTPTQGGAVPPSRSRASPPSSPAFISIQSAARKSEKAETAPQESCPTCQHSPRPEEKFRTTKTLQCNSPAPSRRRDPRGGGQKQPAPSPANQRRELAVLEVQTDRQGAASVLGTKTVTENYERTDDSGNRFYSSKTSTVVTTQPPTLTTPTGHMIISCPPTNQVSTYPEVHLPINYKP